MDSAIVTIVLVGAAAAVGAVLGLLGVVWWLDRQRQRWFG